MTLRLFDQEAAENFREAPFGEIPSTHQGPTMWVDLVDPTRDEITAIGERFGLHELAIEDAQKRNQRPKTDIYGQNLFIIIYALDPPDTEFRAPMRQISIYLTPDMVVTMRRAKIHELDTAADRWRAHCLEGLPQTAAMLGYTIFDSIVDGYFPMMDDFGEAIEDIESEMFAGRGRDALERVFRLKRELLEIRRVVAPTREVFNAMTRRELPVLGTEALAYYQDVYDHVIRVTDNIDAYRDVLSSMVDVHLSLVSNDLNQTVRTLTVVSIILMSASLIAGIYGMNFALSPANGWHYGFWFAIGLMVAIGVGLGGVLKRIGWW